MRQADRECAVRIYTWRLRDHSGSAQYRHIAGRIRKYTESTGSSEWAELLCAVALVETHERGLLIRAAEWAMHALTLGRSGLTLGPFQLTNAPRKLPLAIDRVVVLCHQRQVNPSLTDSTLSTFAKLWYGHDFIERGSALKYAVALRIALNIIRTQQIGLGSKGPRT